MQLDQPAEAGLAGPVGVRDPAHPARSPHARRARTRRAAGQRRARGRRAAPRPRHGLHPAGSGRLARGRATAAPRWGRIGDRDDRSPTTPPAPATDAVLTGAVDLARAAARGGRRVPARSASTSAPTSRASGWSPTASPASTRPTGAGTGRSPSPGSARQQDGDGLRGGPAARRRRAARPGVGAVEQRLAPGDLGVGDLLPTDADDDRLEPGYTAPAGRRTTALRDGSTTTPTGSRCGSSASAGRGCCRRLGRDDAVDRWYSGDTGRPPRSPRRRRRSARPAAS